MNTDFGERSLFSQAQGLVVRRIADETILVPTTGELAAMQKVFVLDEVGEFVWGLLDGRQNIEALARSLSEEFAVSFDQAREDVGEFIGELVDAGLVLCSR